jgi:superoxide dismutase, Cu-Zn family
LTVLLCVGLLSAAEYIRALPYYSNEDALLARGVQRKPKSLASIAGLPRAQSCHAHPRSDQTGVTFKWKDYRFEGRERYKIMTLAVRDSFWLHQRNRQRREVFGHRNPNRSEPSMRLVIIILKWAGTVTMASFVTTGVAQSATTESANAMLKDTNGQEVGTASFTQTPAGVLLKLSIREMTPGEHAFHIHAVGRCEAPSFESAGPHFNPGNTHHGIMAGTGHAGDMPNLHIPPAGALEVEMVNAAITLDKGKPNSPRL